MCYAIVFEVLFLRSKWSLTIGPPKRQVLHSEDLRQGSASKVKPRYRRGQ